MPLRGAAVPLVEAVLVEALPRPRLLGGQPLPPPSVVALPMRLVECNPQPPRHLVQLRHLHLRLVARLAEVVPLGPPSRRVPLVEE